MQIPDFLHAFEQESIEYLKGGLIKEVNFSQATYQIEVQDKAKGTPNWVFIQFSEENGESRLKDLFCSCDAAQKGMCAHMAASVRFIFLQHRTPLHKRFYASFWQKFFQQIFEKCLPVEPKITRDAKKKRVTVSCREKPLLQLTTALRWFFEEKPKETEETSIKFSNLTDEELDAWKQGRPSAHLRFELSPLSDMAKWFFLEEAFGRECCVEIEGEEAGEDFRLMVKGEGVELEASLSKEELIELIPFLSTVRSVPRFFGKKSVALKDVAYDPKKACLTVQRKKITGKITKGKTSRLGPFLYEKNVGFYLPQEKIAEREVITDPEAMGEFLDEAEKRARECAPGLFADDLLHTWKYALSFDSKGCLHIQAYLFSENDFLLPTSRSFGSWAYVEGHGFVKVAPLRFATTHTILTEKKKISEFIHEHKSLLNSIKGFEVHLSKIRGVVTFQVDEQGALTFSRSASKELPQREYDCGDFVYRTGFGFFLKEEKHVALQLPLDTPIAPHLVAECIRRHMDLLQSIKGFFAQTCPIHAIGLNIRLKKRGVVEILPDYEWHDEKDRKNALFYEEFVYVKGKGFFRLLPTLRPLHYIRTITSDDAGHWNSFFTELLPKLKTEVRCTVDPRLELVQDQDLTLQLESRKEEDHGLVFHSHFGKAELSELYLAAKKSERFVPTSAGCLDLSKDRFLWLKTVEQKRGKGKGKTLSTRDLFLVQAHDEIHFAHDEAKDHIFKRILTLQPEEKPVYPALQSDLRPYQQHGVEWLWFLYKNGLSGLLCDDMGVGKTHQAMGLMAAIKHEKKEKKPLFIVICPTSLIYHWQEKIAKFLPTFRVKSYVGIGRTLDDFPGEYDILLTTYGTFRNEKSAFHKFYFDVAFFDELQIAKNHVSQIYAALFECRAHTKIGVTGTPIENALRELKALFDLVLPGYMPEDQDFRELFVRPIEKEANRDRRALLSRYVRPFVLRRRKQDVLPDLPEKTEDIAFAELIGEQKSLYKSVAEVQSAPLLQLLKDEATPIPYMHIFALLSALKQICNHPAAYLKDVANFERYESGKWEAFIELLEEAEESEQKVAVFSQYLFMLDIIEAYLKKKKIGYAQIRGATRARGEEVHRFNNDPNCRIFLGSLQAAGLGIDLTGASIVIHYDRWWNPARENQATDRVHRLGQTRGVLVFKMLTKGTIEEKIDLMIRRKSRLLEDIVSFDEHDVMKRFSRQEMISLLEGLGKVE